MTELDLLIGENIRIFAQAISEICQRNTRKEVCPTGMSRNQFYILKVLANAGHSQIKELARMLDISSAAASKNVDRLESLGLVSKRVNPDDRRSQDVAITEAGSVIVGNFDAVTLRKQEGMLARFSVKEKRMFLGMLKTMIQHTLADEQDADLICLQCQGRCGDTCVIQDRFGSCASSEIEPNP